LVGSLLILTPGPNTISTFCSIQSFPIDLPRSLAKSQFHVCDKTCVEGYATDLITSFCSGLLLSNGCLNPTGPSDNTNLYKLPSAVSLDQKSAPMTNLTF